MTTAAVALIMGLAGAAFIAFYVYFYEVNVHRCRIMPQVNLFSLAPVVFFLLFVVMGLIAPLLRRISPALSLGRRDLVLMAAIWMLTSGFCFREVIGSVLHSAGNSQNPAIQRKMMKRIDFPSYLNHKLYLSPAAANEYYYGLSEGTDFIRPWPPSPFFKTRDLRRLRPWLRRLRDGEDALSRYLWSGFRFQNQAPADMRGRISAWLDGRAAPPGRGGEKAVQAYLRRGLSRDLNSVLRGRLIYERGRFGRVKLAERTRITINRRLLEAAYPRFLDAGPAPVPWPFRDVSISDLDGLCLALAAREDAISAWLAEGQRDGVAAGISPETMALIARTGKDATMEEAKALRTALVDDLNKVIRGPIIRDPERLPDLRLDRDELPLLNRLLLTDAFPRAIPPLAPSVRWSEWVRPLMFWVPFILAVIVLSVTLVRMMHRQWSQHELLTYPLAEIAESTITRSSGRTFPDAFYSKPFWIGFAITTFIYVVNGLHNYFPLMVQIPIEFEHRQLLRNFPFLSKYCGSEAYSLFRGWGWPFMIAIAVLLPAEISLSAWLGYVLMILGAGLYFLTTGDAVTHTDQGSMHTGMYLAMTVIILYLGRREYTRILALALVPFLRLKERPPSGAVWACRGFLLACVVLVGLLVYAGLDWLIAVALVLAFAMVALLGARLTAEIGFPWLVNFSRVPSQIPLQVLGAPVIGPKGIAVLKAVGGLLFFRSNNMLSAQATTVEKLAEPGAVRRGRLVYHSGLLIGVLFAVAVTIFFQLWNQYSFGSQIDSSSTSGISRMMESASNDIRRLEVEMDGARLDSLRGLAKLGEFQFETRFWWFFAIGAAIILGCAFMRLRFAWWPFHPLPFLLVNTWCMSRLYQSLLLGWIIKAAILHVGGGDFYHRSRRFFMGVIFGQIVTCVAWICIDGLYYVITGRYPPLYRYFA